MPSDIASDPNVWTTGELINIALFAILYLSCLTFAIRKTLQKDHGRFYFMACAVLVVVGMLAMVLEPFNSTMSGEMPPQAGLGAWVMFLGLFGTIAAIVWGVARRVFSQR